MPGDYATLLRNAYLDEVRVPRTSVCWRRNSPTPNGREKLETLQTVEARTVTTMDRLLGQVGLKVDTNRARKEGRELAQTALGRGLGNY